MKIIVEVIYMNKEEMFYKIKNPIKNMAIIRNLKINTIIFSFFKSFKYFLCSLLNVDI